MRRYLRSPEPASPQSVGEAVLTLYSRQNCHLCEQMFGILKAHGLDAVLVDVDSDPVLRERYGLAVPVLFFGDTEVCRYHLDIAHLQSLLATFN